MHIVLTDILTCPRCGPDYGLILLAESMRDRRVVAGALGCSNCREKYPVRGGDIRFDQAPVTAVAAPATTAGADPDAAADPGAQRHTPPEPDAALRLAALLGITHGPGFMLVVGPAVVHASELAAMIEDIEVVAADVGWQEDGAEREESVEREVQPGVNRLRLAAGSAHLPLASGKVPGIALTGVTADDLLEEAARVLSAVGRLVLDPAPADAEARLTALGLRVLAREGVTIAAARY